MRQGASIMIVAGEVSGDLLGGGVMQAIREQRLNVSFHGVGGAAMQAQGLRSAFPMSDLSVMGVAEVIRHIPKIYKRMGELIKLTDEIKPDLLLTIDAPDFNLRLARKIKRRLGIPCIHYVSPSVWAWRRGRARKMARFLDHVLALFPFEPNIYQNAGLKCTFVGHPVTERLSPPRKRQEKPVIALLPGSRRGVIHRHLPLLLGAFRLLRQTWPDIQGVIPLADATYADIIKEIQGIDLTGVELLPPPVFDRLGQCRAALAVSGTSNLELAMLDVPMAAFYVASPITYAIARLLVRTPYVSPVNWVFDGGRGERRAVPELLQGAVTAENLSAQADLLLKDTPARAQQLKALAMVRQALKSEVSPSQAAAGVVLSYIQ